MEKVLIIGSPGAGKSTFARKLHKLIEHPLTYLDRIWHLEDQTNVSRSDFDKHLQQILNTKQWIIDGNYLRTLEMRLQKCDTVFLLDYPVELCLAGALARVGQKREDMPWVEKEFDAEFRQWIIDFPKDQLPIIYEFLNQYREKNIVVFKTREDADDYLTELTEELIEQ